MKRNYASGSQKRKKKKEEEDKKNQNSATPSTSSSTSTDSSLLSADVSSIAQATPSIASLTVEDTAASRTEIETAPLPNTEVTSTAQGTTSTVIIADDPAQWPAILTDSVRCQIVKKGPVQVTNIVFPQNSENPPRRFTNENYMRNMKNGEKILRSWMLYATTVFAL